MSSSGPDAIVERAGEEVDHEFVTEYDLDENGQVSPESIETETETIKAIVSDPTEEDEQRAEGRLSTGAYRLTVASDHDVSGERGGRRDRFQVRGQWTVVVTVSDDRHPLTGTRKQTVLVDRLDGHGGAIEDSF